MTEEIVGELQRIVRAHRQLDAGAHGLELRPVLPCGPHDAAICFVGRDPGEKEAKCGRPFIGESGQRLRDCLLEFYAPSIIPSEQSRLEIGERFFWVNTVPFKPKRNKPWSQPVRVACQPMLLQLMQSHWGGRDVVTFGNEAFFWFGIGQPRATRKKFRAFWNQGDIKYERSIEVPLPGLERTVRLHPMPHPSLANARWRVRFPELFKQRLFELSDPIVATQRRS
ncbi:uracil-DNA glycosylase family protein [Variovorax gossypii]|nr:uracil-DNA glycosylase family protein [Variovorax gossypii]